MIRTAVRATLAVVVLAVLTGLVYPAVMTVVAEVGLHDKADGSLVELDGQVVGSASIGQQWTGPEWFQGRPSSIDNDASTSSGSNLGPNSPDLSDLIKERADAILKQDGSYHPGLAVADIPIDLLTASASGLDPDITEGAALFQVPRVAAVTGLDEAAVRQLVEGQVQGRDLGFIGEPRVNVLKLNLALSRMAHQ